MIIIRHATEEDASAMGEAQVAMWLSAHRGQIPEEAWLKRVQEWTPDVSAQGWARELRAISSSAKAGQTADTCIYLAIDETERIVGIVIGYPSATSRTAEIGSLYVHASFQRQGIGRRLVQAVAAYMADAGFSALQLGVLALNTSARRFYEAIGGEIVADRKHNEGGSMECKIVYRWSNIQKLAGDVHR